MLNYCRQDRENPFNKICGSAKEIIWYGW